jgi:hypothetical protein
MTNSMSHNGLIRRQKLILSDKINTLKIIFMTVDWLPPIPLKELMTSFSVLKVPQYCVLKKKYVCFIIICFFGLDAGESESASGATAVVNRPYIKAPDKKGNYF